MLQHTPAILEYLRNLKRAHNESAKKELLKGLLHSLFGHDAQAKRMIDEMSVGAEKVVFNIKIKERTKTGYADTQYNKVIIEFENDLAKTGKHAIDQLAEYLSGNWNSGDDYNFTLITSDCLTWKIYAPTPESTLGKKKLNADDIELTETESFTLTDKNTDDFYFFLDHYLFRDEQIKATLENIQHFFGDTSPTFITCMHVMRGYFVQVMNEGEVKVAYEEWNKFLSIAYGSFQGSGEVFLVHTYLSIFSKMLAHTILSHDEFIDEDEIRRIIKGDIFHDFNVENFVEDDFYHWVASERSLKALKKVFRKIAQTIGQFDFTHVDEDILKGVYQELIDLETRHALGEYYTPDWLCEKIVERCAFKKDSYILDPACGSGSFLRAAIAKLKKEHPDLSAEHIATHVMGIDIHPLSVQIAKTTLLVALGKSIREARRPVPLKVFLANTLIAPKGEIEMFDSYYKMKIDETPYPINMKVFRDADIFNTAVHVCDELAEQTMKDASIKKDEFSNSIHRKLGKGKITDDEVDSFYEIYSGIKKAKENNRDSIWKFILQNSHRPFFLQKKLDFIIGNPPWFTFNSIKNSDYSDLLRELAENYNIIPDSPKNFANMEIAMIFLCHASNYFLKDNGEVSFVLPASLFSGDAHSRIRKGEAKGFLINEMWELDVTPLFNIPACVLIAKRQLKPAKNPYSSPINGLSIKGRFKYSNLNLEEAKNNLSTIPIEWYLNTLQKRTSFSTTSIKTSKKANFYKDKFRKGADIIPRNFYFIDITQKYEGSIDDRVLTVKNADHVKPEAKAPWKEISISGKIHTSYLYLTALAKNIAPFALITPPFVLLPISLTEGKKIKLLDWKEIRQTGHIETSTWFKEVEEYWDKYKTEKSKKITSTQWLNWQNKLTVQNLNKPFLVLYTSSAKDANAVVVKRKDLELNFIADHKAYLFSTDDLDEAYYLSCYLNSSIPNKMIKSFQTKGLFGPRDVHKKILEVPFPQYDAGQKKHRELAALGKAASAKAQEFVSKHVDVNDYRIGKVRVEVKKELKKEIEGIDEIVGRLVG